jgi:crotonobetainyl-CoA:carnitine CoA-transferase CaiB-like acyl-CoA transferase
MNDGRGEGPLRHVRVLDLTQFLAGPFCTQILGDLGADVIKVEAPAGDLSRHLPPHFVAGESAYYLSTNRNKRSMVVDLKTEAGRDVIERLMGCVDIVVENYRPGVMDRLGLRYDEISDRHPSLIWCSITGFGSDGPYRDRPAYDMVVQALAGTMSLTGEPDGRPVRTGIPLADLAAGMYAVIGLQAALEERRESGLGQHVDISMLDVQVAMLSYQAAYHLVSGDIPGRQGTGHDSIPTYRGFVAGDGRMIAVTANTERMWHGLCTALELEGLTRDARFVTNADRYAHRHELWPILDARFAERDADAWLTRLLEAQVPASIVNDLAAALRDPQVVHRGMVVDLRSEEGESVRVVGDPVRLSRSQRETHDFPPPLGRDTELVVAELLGQPTDPKVIG